MVPWSSSLALSASNPLANVTKPNPFDPRSLNMISTSSKVPYFWKIQPKDESSALKSNWIESPSYTKKMQWWLSRTRTYSPTYYCTFVKKTKRGNLLRTGAEKSSLHIKSHHNCSFGQKHGFLRFGLLFLLGISNVYSSFLPTFIYLKCVHKCYLKPKRVELGNKLTSLKKTSVKLVSQVAD